MSKNSEGNAWHHVNRAIPLPASLFFPPQKTPSMPSRPPSNDEYLAKKGNDVLF